jgi:hypothetical protein
MPWLIAAMGLGAACLAFVIGWWFVGRQAQPPATAPSSENDWDVFIHGSSSDRRAAPRRHDNCVEVLLTSESQESPIHGWVVNRSLKGLGLTVGMPIPVGTILGIRPCNAPDSATWTQIEVRYCRPQGTEWDIGCAFLRAPTYNVLLLFG